MSFSSAAILAVACVAALTVVARGVANCSHHFNENN